MKYWDFDRTPSTALTRICRQTLLTAIVLCAAFSLGSAQNPPEFGVVPLSGPDGMVLVIGGPLLHPSTATQNRGWIGYHIYRKAAGDTGFVRITSSPLSRPGTLAELERAMGGPIDGFERFAGLPNKQELWNAVQRNDSAIIPISFLSKNFRRALGLLITDAKVNPGTSYEYRATMVAADGKESAPSEAEKATYGVPLIPLLGPLSLRGTSSEKGVMLSWKANPADSGAMSYSVYRCPDSVGTFLKLNLAALTLDIDSVTAAQTGTFTDTTARAGRTYYYVVVSADYAGNESPRTRSVPVLRVDESKPSIPQNVFAKPSGLGIELTWDTVPGSDIAGYNVYRSTDADSLFTRLNTGILPPDTGYFEDRSTTLINRYFYRVTAVNRSGRESEQSARALSLFENRRRPMPPQNVKANPRPNGVAVDWQPSDEPDVRGYYVYRADSYNGVLSQVSPLVGRDTVEYLDTSDYLSAEGQYWYLVQAVNFTGMTSTYSAPAVTHPDKPRSADAPQSFFGYADDSRARLFWTRSDDNATAGYNVYRADTQDSLNWKKLTVIPLPRTAGAYTDSTGAANATYLYQVRAVNDKATEGQPSHNMRVTFFEAAPVPPGGIRISAEGKALKLVWAKSLQTSVAGYLVYRRSDAEPSVTLTAQPLPAATTEYRDSAVRSGVRYYYSITCVDQAGREGDRSVEVPYLCE